jgi:hypothetical protein
VANSTVATVSSATPDFQDMLALLVPQLEELCGQLQAFRRQPPTPERTCSLEKKRPKSFVQLVAWSWRTNTTASSLSNYRIVRCG